MNSFADRFSSTGAAVEIRRARELTSDDDELSDAMWGTQGGLGNIAKGVHKFAIPAVADVCLLGCEINCKTDFCHATHTSLPHS